MAEFTKSDFETIRTELVPRGFDPVQGLSHFRSRRKDERVVPPRPRIGQELGFAYEKDELAVVVWTTWRSGKDEAVPSGRDCGWVVIEQMSSHVRYFVSVRRRRNFIYNLLMEAKIARARLRHRPHCPSCGRPAEMTRGKGLGSRYWRCPERHSNLGWDTEEFLNSLPLEAKKYLERKRKARLRYYRLLRKLKKPIRQAMLKRKAWRRVSLPIFGF